MRISGGALRGKTVYCPPGIIRPAMDRMRESMFSILGPVGDTSFLDLFSGSGLVGIEAWSRGARPVVLVEKDRGKREGILRNIAGLEPSPLLRIAPVERFLQRNRRPFEIVYLDPPFSYPFKEDVLQRLAGSPTVTEGSLVLIHAPASETLPELICPRNDTKEPVCLRRYDERRYGGSQLTFFRAQGTTN